MSFTLQYVCIRSRFSPISRAFSNQSVFDESGQRISVDGRPKTLRNVGVFKRKRISVNGA